MPSEKIKIAYSFKHLANGWTKMLSGTMQLGKIYGHSRLSMKETRRAPVIMLGENYAEGDMILANPFLLKKGQYFKWEQI